MCLPPIHLRIHWHLIPSSTQALQLQGYRHNHLSVDMQGDIAVPALLQLLTLISAHPECLPW